MADPQSKVSSQMVGDCGMSLDGSYGLDLAYNLSQPCASPSEAISQHQASYRGYRKLFFGCKLHLVLQNLLSRSRLPRSMGAVPTPPPISEPQHNAKHEFTDAEVARLMRQHFNILVSSRTASEEEVISAAKLLEQQFGPPVVASIQDETVAQRNTHTRQIANLEDGSQNLLHHKYDCIGVTAGPLEEVESSCSGRLTMDPSQATDCAGPRATANAQCHSLVCHQKRGTERFEREGTISQGAEA
ncbi:uncharacterized protein LOC34617972 [Cyclospora cayetanensis]|uniref:Uncharacterized protein n=2 Tax=Cyclospora cayetanensis TaxID=88456 RepID=A0A1D3CV96_9EIME|nr:uncharacterized protein LOC34617972 [Cyclospora cayetanensis]OEH75125.1 hypothetical protein cyc_00874 [Cyclospora cayetanensis]